ncbi:AgmX/PglI C-terminal domain-containing protein [Nannocystis exedens]|uniref:AgmX/PglI C-terminal domain-containing protein n=1 Tax=Nannocystis exedens TaxID=54 RepID=UPI000BBA0292|nr:AgmX/PglI C-terminal domain-containing protein [Nannocystis exedens]PCC68205.1 hypothetical protein NAEX_01215 [Nannocystis exedens]
MSRVRSSVVLAALLTGACERAAAPVVEVPTVAPVDDPWTARSLASMGERAAFVAVVHPRRWAALQPRLRSLLPEPLATYLKGSEDPARWPELVLAALDIATTAPALASWDRTRPLVLALAEVPHGGPPGTIAAGFPLHLRALPGLRHQILVPATDPAALAAELGQQFGALGPTVATRFAGRAVGAWALGEGDWLAVVLEADAVRLVVVRGTLAPEGFFADPAHAALRGGLPDLGAARATAGTTVLAGEAHAGVLVRPQRLPTLWTWMMAREGVLATQTVVPSQRAEVVRWTVAMLAACETLHGNEAPEVEDYALVLTADDVALRLRTIVSLTARGAAAVDAGTAHAVGPLSLLRADLPAHGWLRFDTTAAQQSLGPPGPPLPGDDFATIVQECGGMFSMFGTPAAPLGGKRRMWNAIVAQAPADAVPPTTPANTIVQVALTDLAAAKVRGAVAVHDLETAEHEPAVNVGPLGADVEVTLQTRVESGGTRSLLGFGVDPATIFGVAAPDRALAAMQVDLAAAVPALQPYLPEVAALLPFRRAELRALRSGQALDVELVLASGDAPLQALDLSAVRWPEPPAPVDPTCSAAYAIALRRTLEPSIAARPIEAVIAGLTGLDQALACSTLADQAAALRRAATMIVADTLIERWRTADALRVLEGPCSAGDAELCAQRDRLRADVAPQLPRVTSSCEGVAWGRVIAVNAAGITLDGVRVADPPALRAAIAGLVREGEPPLELALAFDERMTLAQLRPIFAALAGPPRPSLSIVVFAGEPGAVRQLVFESPAQEAGVEDLDLAPYLDMFLARVDGEQVTLSQVRSPQVPEPADTAVGDRRLLVAAGDDSSWRAVAGAIARGCGSVRLIDSARLGPGAGSASASDGRPVKAGAGTGTVGRLDKDIIRRIVQAHVAEVRLCYNQGLARHPNLKGRVVIDFTVGGDGKVADAASRESSVADGAVPECITAAVRRWVFPRPEGGGSVKVTYPFVLEPG